MRLLLIVPLLKKTYKMCSLSERESFSLAHLKFISRDFGRSSDLNIKRGPARVFKRQKLKRLRDLCCATTSWRLIMEEECSSIVDSF